MNITPRKNEWERVAELMESAEFSTPEALAKAIVKHLYGTFLERDWFLTLVKVGETAEGSPLQVAYGLAATQRDADRLGLPGPRMTIPVSSLVKLLRYAEGQDGVS